MRSFCIHRLAKQGCLDELNALLPARASEIDTCDRSGYTALMHAVESADASVEVVRLLLDHGADVHREGRRVFGPVSALVLALQAGVPEKVALLLERGADIHYLRVDRYDALVDAVHGRDVARDPRLLDLLALLVRMGVRLDGVTRYQESACRVLSRVGRFDAVALLLEAGAPLAQLEWTPLMRTVALGTAREVHRMATTRVQLEETDYWERTPWLIAIQTGSVAKARLLLERGARRDACGRCGKPPVAYAIESHRTPMLRWLLEIGCSAEACDDFGRTALVAAVEHDNLEAVEVLIAAGASLDREHEGQTALSFARSRAMARRLLEAGADPKHLPFEARRGLVGLPPDPDAGLLDVTAVQYAAGRSRRFGRYNPEQLESPFCEGMIRAGISAYEAAQLFAGEVAEAGSPLWCAHRYGQSLTVLADGTIIQIGGEHEDSYDPDFCIYNDVFVHTPDGRIRIFGYPEAVFPPTDFHTATLVGAFIYIVGSLGYEGARCYGHTPVYSLHTRTLRIEAVAAKGQCPGWIYQHRALAVGAHEIRIEGGIILSGQSGAETSAENPHAFVFDTVTARWSKC